MERRSVNVIHFDVALDTKGKHQVIRIDQQIRNLGNVYVSVKVRERAITKTLVFQVPSSAQLKKPQNDRSQTSGLVLELCWSLVAISFEL